MFRIIPQPTFAAAAKISVPGEASPGILNIEWRHQGRAALKRWIESLAGASDSQALLQVIADWQGVVDEAGQPVAFTAPALEALLDAFPAAGSELCRCYLQALTESRLGN